MQTLAAFPFVLQLHVAAALAALLLGPVALLRRRRDALHKAAGYGFVAAMALLAGGSFWIEAEVLPIALGFGPIHILSVVVLHGLWRGVAAARAGDHVAHAGWMRGLYWQALLVAGAFTLLPGRRLPEALFPDHPWAGLVILALTGTVAALAWLWRRRVRRVGFSRGGGISA